MQICEEMFFFLKMNLVFQKIAYMDCGNKYYIEIYVDCYQDDYEDNYIYIQDFIECFHEIDFLNIQLEEE